MVTRNLSPSPLQVYLNIYHVVLLSSHFVSRVFAPSSTWAQWMVSLLSSRLVPPAIRRKAPVHVLPYQTAQASLETNSNV